MTKMRIKDSFNKYHDGEEYLEHIKLKDVKALKRHLKKARNFKFARKGMEL